MRLRRILNPIPLLFEKVSQMLNISQENGYGVDPGVHASC
jgi:hypothetical protein